MEEIPSRDIDKQLLAWSRQPIVKLVEELEHYTIVIKNLKDEIEELEHEIEESHHLVNERDRTIESMSIEIEDISKKYNNQIVDYHNQELQKIRDEPINIHGIEHLLKRNDELEKRLNETGVAEPGKELAWNREQCSDKNEACVLNSMISYMSHEIVSKNRKIQDLEADIIKLTKNQNPGMKPAVEDTTNLDIRKILCIVNHKMDRVMDKICVFLEKTDYCVRELGNLKSEFDRINTNLQAKETENRKMHRDLDDIRRELKECIDDDSTDTNFYNNQ